MSPTQHTRFRCKIRMRKPLNQCKSQIKPKKIHTVYYVIYNSLILDASLRCPKASLREQDDLSCNNKAYLGDVLSWQPFGQPAHKLVRQEASNSEGVGTTQRETERDWSHPLVFVWRKGLWLVIEWTLICVCARVCVSANEWGGGGTSEEEEPGLCWRVLH